MEVEQEKADFTKDDGAASYSTTFLNSKSSHASMARFVALLMTATKLTVEPGFLSISTMGRLSPRMVGFILLFLVGLYLVTFCQIDSLMSPQPAGVAKWIPRFPPKEKIPGSR